MNNSELPITAQMRNEQSGASEQSDPATILADDVLQPKTAESKNQYWERVRKAARAAGLPKREAYQFATDSTEQRWIPTAKTDEPNAGTEDNANHAFDSDATGSQDDNQEGSQDGKNEGGDVAKQAGDNETTTQSQPAQSSRARDDGPLVTGLSVIPEQWPTLPANASLAAEIQWCQANRMRCVAERGDSVSVDLTQAMTPAPSWAALSWLETSIRAYTKFVDVAAKATSQLEDEREHVRREKLAIEEVRSLLAEMLDDPK